MKPTYEQLEAELKKTQTLLKMALARIAELEEKLNLNSKNSSKPPSSDQKADRPDRTPKSRSSRKGVARTAYPPERVDHHVECTRSSCPHCDSPHLHPLDESSVWQQVELPELTAIVTQYNLQKYCCQECGQRSSGELPKGVPPSAFGPHLMALIATLTGRFHLAKREAMQLVADLYGIGLSEGSIINIEEKVGQALGPVYERVHAFVIRGKAPRYFDETSWRDSGQRHYVWIATTPLAACYRIDRRRSQSALERLVGKAVQGAFVSDRYHAYTIMEGPRQYCLAHLIRDFHKHSEKKTEDGPIGARIEQALRDVCRIHTLWKKQRISKHQYSARLREKKRCVEEGLYDGLANGSDKLSGLCDRILDQFECLWTFRTQAGVDPTNNLAERDLRKLVLWRKKSYGTRSQKGQRFVERMTSVVETLKKQGQGVFDFLKRSLRAHYSWEPPPFIAPELGF